MNVRCTTRLLLVTTLAGSLAVIGAGPTAASTPQPAQSVQSVQPAQSAVAGEPTLSITTITPRLPTATATDRSIKFAVTVTAGTAALTGVALQLHRGNPLINEDQLRNALKSPPATADVDIPALTITGSIPAGQSRAFTLVSTVDNRTADGAQGLCLSCNPGVYPVDVSLSQTDTDTELARAHTFIPYFATAPTPVGISWVWPLLDRPHRTLQRTVFDDDDLATSLAAGGRLSNALRVAELVAGKVRLTLVVDPDLIDSIQVMSAGGYTVRGPTGTTVAGTGTAAAAAWLARLTAVAARHDVVRTAYADPDVDSLSRNGVNWSTNQLLDPRLANSLRTVLGVDPGTWLAWPNEGKLSGPGLDDVVANGASAALVGDFMFPAALGQDETPNALAPLPSASGQATAVILDSTLQALVTTATATTTGPAAWFASTQTLAAEIAIRAQQNPDEVHYLALAPTRYATVAAGATAALMLILAATPFSADESVGRAIANVQTSDHGTLATAYAGSQGLAPDQLTTLGAVRDDVDAFRECLSDKDALTLLSAYPSALARGESSYFRTDTARGRTLVAALLADITGLTEQVRITSPNNASYTLASSDAPLFITVENRLTVSVKMALSLTPVAGEQGLTIRAPAMQDIPPGIHQIKVQARVARTGRFRVAVTLVSPSGRALGTSSQIRVKSTAFGAVGLWVTGVAFAVLLVALLRRTIRRIRHRSGRGSVGRGDVVAGGAMS